MLFYLILFTYLLTYLQLGYWAIQSHCCCEMLTCVVLWQLELPLYETAMSKMRSLAGAVLSSESQVEERIAFIQQSVTQLLKARHVLKCSYVYGYYLEQTGYKKPIFEYMQVSSSALPCSSFCSFIYRYFVCKLSAMGKPSRPTQPSIPPGSVNE